MSKMQLEKIDLNPSDPDAFRAVSEPTEKVEYHGIEKQHKVGTVVMTLRVQQVVTWLLDGV